MLSQQHIRIAEIETKDLGDRQVKSFEAFVFREEHGFFVYSGRFNAPAGTPDSELWKAVAIALGYPDPEDPDFEDLVG